MDQAPQPSVTPTEPATPTPPANTPAADSASLTPSSNKGLIIGLVVGGVIFLLIVTGIILAVVLGGKNTNSNTRNSQTNSQGSANNQKTSEPSDDSLRAANAETAKYMSDLDVVCDNGSISNAAAFAKPYKLTAFAKNSTSRSYSSVALSYNADYVAKHSDHEKVNVVACLEEKAGTAVKSKTCDFKSSDKTVTLDYYAVKYSLTLREAKTGKLIKTLEDINGPATTCPYFVAYNKSDPKYYAKPDADAANAAIKKFIAE